MDRQTKQFRQVLTRLESTLADMQGRRMRYLNVAEAPVLAEELQALFGSGAPQSESAAADERAGDSPAGRAANVAASLRSGAQPQAPLSAEVAVDGATTPTPAMEEINTLESLFFHFRNCMACGLGTTRNRLVFGAGNTHPRLMFIGEGPGAEEDQQGLPFVGKAGALLTGFIQALGLTRDDVYITNVVKCRPPGNRNPEAGEAAACRPILMRQIELLNPALIVTLGNVPLKAFNPKAGGITRERGRPFRFGDWQVLPTFHPSYLLRNPAGIQDCWRDFKQALQIAYPGPTS